MTPEKTLAPKKIKGSRVSGFPLYLDRSAALSAAKPIAFELKL
jgi:hypothetical protein